MAKVEVLNIEGGGRIALVFCPGCKQNHGFYLDKPASNGAMWTWDGDLDQPTFQPSMLVNKDTPERRCHSFVRKGKIEFLSDCFHELASQTVDLPEFE